MNIKKPSSDPAKYICKKLKFILSTKLKITNKPPNITVQNKKCPFGYKVKHPVCRYI